MDSKSVQILSDSHGLGKLTSELPPFICASEIMMLFNDMAVTAMCKSEAQNTACGSQGEVSTDCSLVTLTLATYPRQCLCFLMSWSDSCSPGNQCPAAILLVLFICQPDSLLEPQKTEGRLERWLSG